MAAKIAAVYRWTKSEWAPLIFLMAIVGFLGSLDVVAQAVDALPYRISAPVLVLIGFVIPQVSRGIRRFRQHRHDRMTKLRHERLLRVHAVGILIEYFSDHLGEQGEWRQGFRVGGFLTEFEKACPEGISKEGREVYYNGYMLEQWIQKNAIAQMFTHGPIRNLDAAKPENGQ